MPDAHAYATHNTPRFLEQLKELLRIPSISTLSEHAEDLRRAATWIAADMRRIGFPAVEVVATDGNPLVFAAWDGAGADAPTVLIYCHYDVQPAALEDGWESDPFEPVERDGALFARGAVDSKSHVVAHLKAAEALLASGGSPVNIKLLFEGEEEISSVNLAAFIRTHRERLAADACIISDGGVPGRQQPAIIYGVRGIVGMELEVSGPATDLHSGQYGGTVHNPVQALAEIVARLHHPDGRVAVPGFYDDVLPLDDHERAELARSLPWFEDQWQNLTGAPQPWGEPGYNLHERIGARPTLELNGIVGGFHGEGLKTVLPARATAKISCRLVANQQPVRVFEGVRGYVAGITPPTVRSEVRMVGGTGDPALIALNTPVVQAAMAAYQKAWGQRPVLLRAGGSLPITADFQRELGIPIVFMPFGYAGARAHGPNEFIYLDMWEKGIHTAINFAEELAKQAGA